MALIGIYVGVIPVALGMLWLPWLRRVDSTMAAGDHGAHRRAAGLPRHRRHARGRRGGRRAARRRSAAPPSSSSGRSSPTCAVAAVDALADGAAPAARRRRRQRRHLALLIAIGIGLHNLGEGLAIGAAYSLGALALGSFLVIGFALHNTTEGLAIVAPLSGRVRQGRHGARVAGERRPPPAAVRWRLSPASGSSPARRRSSAPGSGRGLQREHGELPARRGRRRHRAGGRAARAAHARRATAATSIR